MGTAEKTLETMAEKIAGTYKVGDCEIELPRVEDEGLDQDEEWLWLDTGDGREKVRFHDYERFYDVPGLYEHVFYDHLKCTSPETVCGLLEEGVRKGSPEDSPELRVLDVGAGNGMVGEVLEGLGAEEIVGVDIIEEAAEATDRDRPGVYDDYHVVDLTDIPEDVRKGLEAKNLNCLTTVAALGFGDMPPQAFAEAYNLVDTPGWLAFNIKQDFMDQKDETGFSGLVRSMVEEGLVDLKAKKRYLHRYSLQGQPIYYMAFVGEKREDVPLEWMNRF